MVGRGAVRAAGGDDGGRWPAHARTPRHPHLRGGKADGVVEEIEYRQLKERLSAVDDGVAMTADLLCSGDSWRQPGSSNDDTLRRPRCDGMCGIVPEGLLIIRRSAIVLRQHLVSC